LFNFINKYLALIKKQILILHYKSVFMYKCLSLVFLLLSHYSFTQIHTHADSLRGTYNANRSWWDVTYYDIKVKPDLKKQTIEGSVTICFKVIGEGTTMQIDLQEPLQIKSIKHQNTALKYKRDGNAFLVSFPKKLSMSSYQEISIQYSGKPRRAVNAPWDGGIVWERDEKGRPFINTACQGLGASVWWPTKDHQNDECDSAQLSVTVPKDLTDVSNGRLRKIIQEPKGLRTFVWFVSNPINNYNLTMNIGYYANFKDTLAGEKGILDMNYYVLDYNVEKAKKQFVQAKETVRAFEYWFGPYPFYEDSYKLVETHHLGMEHQSAVAYGNKYMNGYLGSDLSGSGWGKKWDYIIVHETGHEWFGNNVTTKDIADMWVHEGITDYSETLFTEYYYGKEAGNQYNRGLRRNILNMEPIIGPYEVNKEGSGDMYPKGANIMHTIRQLMNDDEKFRTILRGLGKVFYHKTVTSKDVEDYISKESGIDFSKFFDQYLRDTRIPKIKYYYKTENNITSLYMKFINCVEGFTMNLPISSHHTKNDLFNIAVNDIDFVKLDLANDKTTITNIINPNIYIRLEEQK
jgi:aminopeptidase N